jgi:serine/threonine-protein kinase
MSEEPGADQREPPEASIDARDAVSFWARVRDHKIIQWAVAYLGASLAVGQGHQLVAGAFQWPDTAGRILVVALIVGFPVALTLAWYHGHRGLKSVTTGELTIISILMLIGGVFFTLAVNPPDGAPDKSSRPQQALDEAGGSVEPRPVQVLPNSVAVLPCANQSPDPNNAIFAVGIHEEILLQLAKLRNLNVPPRRAVLRYAGSDLGAAQIGAELGVQAVVDCSVRYADNRVRISAELIDADSGATMWIEGYERDLQGVFEIQADIAMNIANAVGAEFSSAEQAQLEQPLTTSGDAYRLFMQARALIANQSPESIRQALLLRDRALEVDPDFALARGERVLDQVLRLVDGVGPSREGYQDSAVAEQQAREEIQRSLARDPTLWQPRAARALLEMFTWRWQDGIAEFRELVSNPRPDDRVILQYPFLAAYLGNPAESLPYLEGMIRLDDESLQAYQIRGIVYGYARNYDAAVADLRRAQDLLPANPLVSNWLAYVEISRGNEAEALAALEFTRRLLGDDVNLAFWAEFAYAYHRLGRQDEAERFYRDIERVATTRSIGAGTWAVASLAIGDNQKALDWLRQVADKARKHEIDEGFYAVMNLKMDFTNDPLLKEPEFAEALDRIRGD